MSAVKQFVKKVKVCIICKGDAYADPDEQCVTQCGHRLCSIRCFVKLRQDCEKAERKVGVPKHHCHICNTPHLALHMVGKFSECRYPTAFEMDPFGCENFADTSLSSSVLHAAKVLEDAKFSIGDVIAILLQKERNTRVAMPYSLARVRELQDTLDRVTL